MLKFSIRTPERRKEEGTMETANAIYSCILTSKNAQNEKDTVMRKE